MGDAADRPLELSGFTPSRLRCDYRLDPLGIDSANPRLDWILQAGNPAARGLAQSAYQILVASSPEALSRDQGDLWDSGKIASDQMSQLAYAGKPLQSSQAVWWKVRAWDQVGDAPSAWSPTAQWTMGVLTQADWQSAKWIGAPDANAPTDHKGPKPKYETVLLRREFTVKPGLKRAIVHVCGLGQYEMTLNGDKVGQDLLTPGWTLYRKTCLYDTYDITSSLTAGVNAIGLFLGNGFYNIHGQRYTKIQGSFGPVQAIGLVRLEYADGTVQSFVTDENWKTSSGPITFSSIYGGEDYDARLVQGGWDKPGFNDTAWDQPALTNGPGGTLKGLSGAAPPIRSFDVLAPVGNRQLNPGVTVYDLGQNAAIMLRLKVKGPAGSSLKIMPSELLKANGDIDDTMCGGDSYWTYTLSGKGDETYFSKFFYRGGRYLRVELRPASGSSELPEVESIEGDTLHADAPAVGQFSCSNEMFNKVYTIIRWAQMNNMVSTLTDCPTREKLGWLEEDHLNGPAFRYNFDLSTLLTKMVDDMADSQRDNGLVPSTCPDFPHWGEGMYTNPPEWGSACIAVPWQQYQFEGDLEILRRHYDTMKGYVKYLSERAKDNIVSFGLGDWYDSGSFGPARLTPIALTATAFYYNDTKTLAKIADLLGKSDEAIQYEQKAGQILDSFNGKFFNPETNTYATGSQASNAVPLALNMVDPANRPAVFANLVKDVEALHQTVTAQADHTTVGEVCLEFLLRALADGGRSDLIYATYSSDQTGYGLQVKQGKTSLAEGWNGGATLKSPDTYEASQDHFMFGEINEWFYRSLAGIQDDPAGPGFKKIIIKPSIVGDLTEVNASYDSNCGKIVSAWKRDGQNVRLHVVIPPNTTATICVPTDNAATVQESGKPAADSVGLKFQQMDPVTGSSVYEAAAGDYTFTFLLHAP